MATSNAMPNARLIRNSRSMTVRPECDPKARPVRYFQADEEQPLCMPIAGCGEIDLARDQILPRLF
jgi:hypothetical protein